MSILQSKWSNVSGGTPKKEVPTGIINGANADFVTSQTAIADSLLVFVDKILETTFTYNAGTKTITLTVAPILGQDVYVAYRY